ncbi:DUF4142 domain-containing protein [Actinoplanes sp. NPDC051851]|uniref:DUF4142 domain-containing protein n=1 Tax=Actinoplanes sp. NPDC051851 TaxID=3154753 RepID=UPI003416BE7E
MISRYISVAIAAAGLALLPAATAAQAAPPPARDAAFLQAAHQTNLAEIEVGRIAFTRTKDPQVKTLAAALMRDHIHLDADLYKTARELSVFLPVEPTEAQQALAERYRVAGADTFDEYFITTQLAGHRDALHLAADQVENGRLAPATEIAEQATPVIERHRLMLRLAAGAEKLPGYATPGGRRQ